MVDQVELRWRPIETAVSSAAPEWERANREQKPVIVAAGDDIRIGIVRDFLADDGTLRKGIGAGMGIFMATHWMPLPEPPHPNNTGEV